MGSPVHSNVHVIKHGDYLLLSLKIMNDFWSAIAIADGRFFIEQRREKMQILAIQRRITLGSCYLPH